MEDTKTMCGKCFVAFEEDSQVVDCIQCKTHYHYECVQVNENALNWTCSTCSKQHLKTPGAPSVKASSHRSRASSRSQLYAEQKKVMEEQEKLLLEESVLHQKQAEEEDRIFRDLQTRLHERSKFQQENLEKRKELLAQKKKLVDETIVSIHGSSNCSGSTRSSIANSKIKVNEWMDSNTKNQVHEEGEPCVQDPKITIATEVEGTATKCRSNVIQPNFENIPKTTPPPNVKEGDGILNMPKPIAAGISVPTRSNTMMHPTMTSTKQGEQNHTFLVDGSSKVELSKSQIASRHVVKGLPKFDGSPMSWSKFFSSFQRSTNLCGYSNDENLERLRESLNGNALAAVKGRLNAGIASDIVNYLKAIFGRPEFIINESLKDIRSDQPPTNDNINTLIRFSIQIQDVCATMKDAELSEHLWDPNLLKEMEGKLPSSVLNEWAMYKHSSSQRCNFEILSLWLKEKTDALMTVLQSPPDLMKPKTKSKVYVNVHHNKASCLICQKFEHTVDKCSEFHNLSTDDKWKKVKELNLCRVCLKPHKGRFCYKNYVCGIDDCEFRHNALLHKNDLQDSKDDQKEQVNMHNHNLDQVFFKILPVTLSSGLKSIQIYAILDDCSSVTLLEKSIAEQLNIQGENIPLCLKWTNNVRRREEGSQSIDLLIGPPDSEDQFKLKNVRTVNQLSLPQQSIDMDDLKSRYTHLESVPFVSYSNIVPKLLIGLQHSRLHQITKYCLGSYDVPSAGKTVLGWVIYGGSSMTVEQPVHHVSQCNCARDADVILEGLVRQNYSLESIGISNPEKLPMSSTDKRALSILESSVKFQDKQYEVSLLWKFDHIRLPSSFNMAFNRHLCLERRFKKEPDLLGVISNQIEDYIHKGYASKLEDSQWNKSDANCWYLPIFTVRNPNKPAKIRLVWDAAAMVNGVSLNTVLLKGPDLNMTLPGVLQRFRQYQIALAGDLKEMFHQILVKPEDRQYQRFLWRKSPAEPVEVYVMNVLTFGASCSPTCAQFIKNYNADKFSALYSEASQAIKRNHYVDDWLQSVHKIEDAVKLATDVRYVHSEGGFLIRNWASNSQEVLLALEGANCELKNMELTSSTNQAEKVLGMFWDTSSDEFIFKLKFSDSNKDILSGMRIPTKREVLKVLMSVFDPLGLISHLLIFPKILMQQIWRSNILWDQEISAELFEKWLEWTKILPQIKQLKIPRWIGLKSPNDVVEMHTFTDASEDAFSAVVFFKVVSETSSSFSLVASKSRVSPLRALSVPRLELQAAVLGLRLARNMEVNHDHKIARRYFWTDSSTVIKWLNSDTKRYTQFVSCRIGEILEDSSTHEWHWIDGKSNVADLATKMRISEVSINSPWFAGPSCLPEVGSTCGPDLDCPTTEELRPQHVGFHEAIEFRIEKWRRLRKVTAFVLRYVDNLKRKTKNKTIKTGPLAKEDYLKSEHLLFTKAQKENYSEEYKALVSGLKSVNRRSPIFKDSPFLDEVGVLRTRSRIRSAPYLLPDARQPILLPSDHRITEMVINFYHERYFHRYPSTVLNEIRQKFSIPNLRVKLKVARKRCQFCKNNDAKPQVPEEAELPAARITAFTRPFTFTGLDFFGPILVHVGRSHQKRWGMLLTCLTTRALHLEVAHTLSTESCILGLRRFISRRGSPKEIYSDNGTNFRGSRRQLREIWENVDKYKVADSFIDSETEWKFIPPASPHMGGAWERMVRSVKESLKYALQSLRVPTDELLLTLLAEVEAMINSRPLTYVELSDDSQEALTPNHFLVGSSSGLKPLGEFSSESEVLRSNWKKSQLFANIFWKRWTKEYLPTLSRRTKWFNQETKEPTVGDVVIILGEENRNSWPKGRILEVHRGRDQRVRSVTVKTVTGVYVRPVCKIAVLDVHRTTEDTPDSADTSVLGGSVENSNTLSSLSCR